MSVKSEVIVVRADREPMPGVERPGPHQIYRHPRVEVEVRELGALQPDAIRVRMIYAGLCGTDVHLVTANPETGYILSSAPALIPPEGRILGHEGVGEVLARGERVSQVKPGDLVTFESILVCHRCDVCRRGQFNQCRHARLVGLEEDGIFGTVVDVQSQLAHDVTSLARTEEGLRAAACVEPAGVAYVACRNTAVGVGDVVVVFGAGPIGLFCAMLGRLVLGAAEVHVVEPVASRRELARRWSTTARDVEAFFADPPAAVDVLIEASGEMSNVTRLLHRLNANARVALLARSGKPLTLDAVDHLITNQISVIGSRGHLCGAFTRILSLCERGRLPLHEVVAEVVHGPRAVCSLLREPDRVLAGGGKILARLDAGGR